MTKIHCVKENENKTLCNLETYLSGKKYVRIEKPHHFVWLMNKEGHKDLCKKCVKELMEKCQ